MPMIIGLKRCGDTGHTAIAHQASAPFSIRERLSGERVRTVDDDEWTSGVEPPRVPSTELLTTE